MWQTTFAFQKWSSLFEFRRYMRRMIFEFSRIETLEGVTRTPYNQYESVILPLKAYLDNHGVRFVTDTTVTDIDFKPDSTITATALHLKGFGGGRADHRAGRGRPVYHDQCLHDGFRYPGGLQHPGSRPEEKPISGELWSKVASKKPGLGDPRPFFGNMHETNWESFTVTLKGNRLLKMIENYSGNIPARAL